MCVCIKRSNTIFQSHKLRERSPIIVPTKYLVNANWSFIRIPMFWHINLLYGPVETSQALVRPKMCPISFPHIHPKHMLLSTNDHVHRVSMMIESHIICINIPIDEVRVRCGWLSCNITRKLLRALWAHSHVAHKQVAKKKWYAIAIHEKEGPNYILSIYWYSQLYGHLVRLMGVRFVCVGWI